MMAPRRRPQRGRDPVVGHLHLGAQGPQGVDVEVNRPASQLIAAYSGHERLAGEVQERAEQQHRDAVEPAEGQRHRRIHLGGRRDGQRRTGSLHAGAHRRQDAGGDVDVADFGHVGDGAGPLPEDGGDHVLGDGVLGAPDLDLTTERTGRFDEPGVRHAVQGSPRVARFWTFGKCGA